MIIELQLFLKIQSFENKGYHSCKYFCKLCDCKVTTKVIMANQLLFALLLALLALVCISFILLLLAVWTQCIK